MNELNTALKTWFDWHEKNEGTLAAKGVPSDTEIDFEVEAWKEVERLILLEVSKPVAAAIAIPDGYKIVPIDPTERMLRTGAEANAGPRSTAHGFIYRAMVAAAPDDIEYRPCDFSKADLMAAAPTVGTDALGIVDVTGSTSFEEGPYLVEFKGTYQCAEFEDTYGFWLSKLGAWKDAGDFTRIFRIPIPAKK